MSEINLNSGITLSNKDIDIKIPAFLKAEPMPQIDDPEWIDTGDGSQAPKVDEYSTVKEWVEEYLKALQNRVLLKKINKGIDILNRESSQKHLIQL